MFAISDSMEGHRTPGRDRHNFRPTAAPRNDDSDHKQRRLGAKRRTMNAGVSPRRHLEIRSAKDVRDTNPIRLGGYDQTRRDGNTSKRSTSASAPQTPLSPPQRRVVQQKSPKGRTQSPKISNSNSKFESRTASSSGHSATEVIASPTMNVTNWEKEDTVSDASDEEEEDGCCICLEGYTKENPKYFGTCSHHFHYPCLLSWKQRNNTCPMCCEHTIGDPVIASKRRGRPSARPSPAQNLTTEQQEALKGDEQMARLLQKAFQEDQTRRQRNRKREQIKEQAKKARTRSAAPSGLNDSVPYDQLFMHRQGHQGSNSGAQSAKHPHTTAQRPPAPATSRYGAHVNRDETPAGSMGDPDLSMSLSRHNNGGKEKRDKNDTCHIM